MLLVVNLLNIGLVVDAHQWLFSRVILACHGSSNSEFPGATCTISSATPNLSEGWVIYFFSFFYHLHYVHILLLTLGCHILSLWAALSPLGRIVRLGQYLVANLRVTWSSRACWSKLRRPLAIRIDCNWILRDLWLLLHRVIKTFLIQRATMLLPVNRIHWIQRILYLFVLLSAHVLGILPWSEFQIEINTRSELVNVYGVFVWLVDVCSGCYKSIVAWANSHCCSLCVTHRSLLSILRTSSIWVICENWYLLVGILRRWWLCISMRLIWALQIIDIYCVRHLFLFTSCCWSGLLNSILISFAHELALVFNIWL